MHTCPECENDTHKCTCPSEEDEAEAAEQLLDDYLQMLVNDFGIEKTLAWVEKSTAKIKGGKVH